MVNKKVTHKRISFSGKSLLLLILSFFLNSSAETQAHKDQALLQYEVKVTLKLIQAYVTDNKGNPITDLEKVDFIVSDNGKKQSITEFEKHDLSLQAAKEEPQPEKLIETPAQPARELMPRKFFLFFDFAFNNADGLKKAKQAALHFIDRQVLPTDEVGVLSYSAIKSLTLHEYLTTDQRKVRDIVRGFGMKEIMGRAEDFEAEYWSLLKGENPKDATKPGYVFDPNADRKSEVEFLKQQRETSRFQVYDFVQKMTDIAKALRYVPGHKSIIFFSSGVPYSLVIGKDTKIPAAQKSYRVYEPSEGFEHYLSLKFEEMLKELSAANCTIYALDTQEPSSTLAGDFQTRGTFFLQKLTSATGGKYFGNINNYTQHIEKIQKITGCYYVLGYYVDDQWDGRYHKIKVELDRPGCKVYAQKGYFNPKPFKDYSDLEKMLQLVDLALSESPLFQTPLHFSLKAIPCSGEGKQNLALLAKVEKEKIQELSGRKVEIVAIIFDKEANIVKIDRKETDFSQFPEGNIYFSFFLSLSPGEYRCRLVIRNLESGRGAVASSSVIIPKVPDHGVMLYPPMILKAEKDVVYFKVSSTPLPFDPTQYSPLIEELEHGTGSLYAVVRCSLAGIQEAEIKLLANLVHYQANTVKAIPTAFSILDNYRKDDTEVFFIKIQTEELKPGEYFLYLFAEELKAGSNSQVNTSFKVK
jgi:VWFA-related protein